MFDEPELNDHLLSLEGSSLDYPFGEGVSVYKVREKMFALVTRHSKPLRLSLKCDPELAETLRAKYETVMPGYHLNKQHWNTIVLTGQIGKDEVKDLIRHSYELVARGK